MTGKVTVFDLDYTDLRMISPITGTDYTDLNLITMIIAWVICVDFLKYTSIKNTLTK